VLGVPSSERRQIAASTAPLEAKVELNLDDCKAVMLENHPDIMSATLPATTPERSSPGARKTASEPPLNDANARLAQFIAACTHDLERSVSAVETEFGQLTTAKRMKAAARQRLEAQRAFYERGDITIDRYLDAVNRLANGRAQEAQFVARYNCALAALEESKGTLLEHDGIALIEHAKSRTRDVTRDSESNTPREKDLIVSEVHADNSDRRGPTAGSVTEPRDGDESGRAFSFRIPIGLGTHPFEIRGTFTIGPATQAHAAKRP
jgi:hypothetical protein